MKLGKAPRIAYGEELLELAKTHREIVALDADLSKSTMTCLIEEHFPNRFFEMSIAEQNMVATAAGMALKGKIPFVNSFAVFLTGRAFDQIRQSVAYPANNVKLGGSSSGFSDFGDGATHQSIEDLALMRVLPNMIVLSPVDEIETRAMVRFMVEYHGPVYIRLDRGETPLLLDENYRFVLGEPTVLQTGSDVTIFGTGQMVSLALQAAEILAKEGISTEVVNIGTIKPMNAKAMIALAEKTKAVVTAEEHTIRGGLGSAIAETLMKTKIPIVPVGIQDRFGQSAHSYEELLVEYGLTKEAIYAAVKEVLTVKYKELKEGSAGLAAKPALLRAFAYNMTSFQSSVEGKVGILTGGTSGFGYALVQALLRQGANLAVFSVDELADPARAELDAIGKGDFAYYTKDIMAQGASEEMVAQTVARFGQIDFVIANAGFAIRFEEPLLQLSPAKLVESLRTQFEIFPIAFAALALAAARVMAPRYAAIKPDDTGHRADSAAIIVTLSETALCPLRDDLLAYAAAKRACLSIMESLAATLGPQNIRVNGIAPGFANTAGPRKFYDRYPQIRADIEAKTHLTPSFMDPGAIVPAVLYLLTDNYVTGQVIALDGGYHIELKRYFQEK